MKIKSILLLIISMFILGINYTVNASNYNYYISNRDLNYDYVDKNNVTPINVQRGDYIYVTSIISSDNTSIGYQLGKGKLTLRWDASFVDLVETDGKYYNINSSNFTNLMINSINKTSGKLTINEFSSNDTIKLGKNKLLEFKFQVLKNASINTFKIYQMDGEDSINCFDSENNKDIKCTESLYSELKYNVQKSSNNKLANIKLNNQELEYFNENVNEYDIEVEKDVEKITISAEKKDNTSAIGGDIGIKPLAYGINTFSINVISESGDVNTYTLNITRIDERSTINTLKSLKISDIDFIFSPNITEYDLDVNNKIDKVTITSTLTDIKSLYVKDFGNREEKLNEGSNKILVKVLSESGDERVYTFNITRALSGNNTLKSLMVNDDKITLKDDVFIYNHIVETEVDEVVIKALPSDNKATVNIKDNYELEVGDNEINIDIIAPDGSRASYILNINRKKILSDNSNLSNIKIIGYKINFDSEKTLYNLKIKDEIDKLDIYTVPEDTYATVEVEGNENLVDGSIIKINVKAENGTYKRYFINVEKNRGNALLPIIITIIILLGLLALCIMTLIKRKKKKEQLEAKIKEEMIDNKELDSVGAEMDIDAADYEEEISEEQIINKEINNVDNEYQGLHEEKNNENNID